MRVFDVDCVGKEFSQPGQNVVALQEVSLTIEPGQLVAITGESGSGKTTLMTLLAGLDFPTSGRIRYLDIDFTDYSARALSAIRAQTMGFVFQDFLLIRHLSVLDNVRLPQLFVDRSAESNDPQELLERVGLGHRLGHRPDALSRGEMQRVAIARALINRPKVLFADEPTANLDRRNGLIVANLLHELHADGLTVIVATHSPQLLQDPDRVFELDDGRCQAS